MTNVRNNSPVWNSNERFSTFSEWRTIIWMWWSFDHKQTCADRFVKSLIKYLYKHLPSYFPAAHCVIKELIPVTWKLSTVRLGESVKSTDPDCQEINDVYQCALNSMDVAIRSIYPHEFYNSSNANKANDIAVITLKSPVTFTDYVRPICLPIDSRREDTQYGSLTVIGFGRTEAENQSDRLLKAEIDIFKHEICKAKYRVQGRQIQNSQICAIRENSDAW